MTQVTLPANDELVEADADMMAPSVAQSPVTMPFVRLLPLATIALLAGLGVATWIAHAGEVSMAGFLRAEQSVVYAPRAGHVELVTAKTGDSVKPHQTLLVLADASLDREIAAKSREVTALEATLEQCRAKADVQITLELKSLDDLLHHERLQSAEYLREHYAATFEHVTWRNFAKEASTGRMLAIAPSAMSDPDRVFGSLVSDPIVTPEEVRVRAVLRQEDARNSAETKKAQSDMCDTHIQELQKTRKQLPEQIRKAAGVDVAEARLAQATDQLSSLNQQKSAMTVTASGHGLVGSYAKHAGDPVSAGEPLVMVLDRDRPSIEVDVPSRDIGRVKVGQSVHLEIAGEERAGRVESISPQAHRRDQSADSWIAVCIRPSGRLWPEVPIGSAVSVRLK